MGKKMHVASQDRAITTIASLIMIVFVVASFLTVWLLYYNRFAFRTYHFIGCVATIIVYLVVYLVAANTYRAFKIASFPIGETAFSQCLAIGLADLVCYVECCLIYRNYVNILPGIFTVAIQFVFAFVWATLTKQYFLSHVQPQKCILIYERKNEDKVLMQKFIGKIKTRYGHLFDIVENVRVEEMGEISATLKEYPVVFLYEVGFETRSRIMEYCINTGCKAYLTPDIEDVISQGYSVKNLIDTPLYAYENNDQRRVFYATFKRFFDILICLTMLVPGIPIMLVTAVAIKLEDGGDIFFLQRRVGLHGKQFNILKFRSMIMDAEKDGKPRPCIAGDGRITKVGKIIRATRIDELPQIFNVLSGKMSIVGPRPERVEHVEIFTKEIPEFSYRLRVKAGLTGYAQIYGKYNTSARDKLLLDLLYIEQRGFLLDAKIIFLTVKTMFTPEATEGFDEEKSKLINQKSSGQREAVDVSGKA